jgi:hypothetical protein
MKAILLSAVAAVVLLGVVTSLALLLTDHRLLVWERKVDPGDNLVVEGYGNLGENNAASLACWYFTGRSVTTRVFWYGPDGFFGARDQCPFLIKGI